VTATRGDASVAHDGAVEEDAIIVVGVGSADAAPDCVRAHAGVSVVAPTVGEALRGAAAAQQRVIDVLLDAGVERAAIGTVGYQVGPDHEGPRRSGHHRVDAMLEIRLPDAAMAGELLAGLGDAAGDALRIHGVVPEVSDPEPARRTARAAAVAAARAQAEELAAAAGVRLGRLRSLVEGGAGGRVFLDEARPMAGFMQAAAPGVEPGRRLLHVAVTATYDIVPEPAS
jgi:uncharacterized protein YggE